MSKYESQDMDTAAYWVYWLLLVHGLPYSEPVVAAMKSLAHDCNKSFDVTMARIEHTVPSTFYGKLLYFISTSVACITKKPHNCALLFTPLNQLVKCESCKAYFSKSSFVADG